MITIPYLRILLLQDLIDSDGELAHSDERRDQFPGHSPGPFRL